MFVTAVAVLCTLSGICQEEIVTDSNLTPELTFQACLSGGQAPIAKWKSEHPIYHSDKYLVQSYKCVPGHYELKGRA